MTTVKGPRNNGGLRENMAAEIADDLTLDQWELLRALRLPPHERRVANRLALARLIELGLAAWNTESAVITSMGRKVLIRGSTKLWDSAA